MFTLRCVTGEGREIALRYDPHQGRLNYEDGSPVVACAGELPVHPVAQRISPVDPGRKSSAPSVLKIQLGLNCNYHCTYCSQTSEIPLSTASKTADVEGFLEDLDRWMTAAPNRIEFWGGEPLLYWSKLKRLVPALDQRFPDAEFSMVTNGTLLDEEIVRWIQDYDFHITISHDGPGQSLRGEDPFDRPDWARLVRRLWAERKQRMRMGFNAVLTPGNSDPAAIRQWFVAKLNDPDAIVSLEGVVMVHDPHTADGAGYWTPTQYAALRESIAASFESGEALRMGALLAKARDLIDSLHKQRPSTALGQKCGMDASDQIAVDLHSNVLTCQNTGAKGRHGLGSALKLQEVRLDTSTHWSHRECCNHCPVVQLCQGGCMYLEEREFAQSCENEYQFNLGILEGVLRRVWKLKLLAIEGDIRRPAQRRSIPIFAAA